MKTYYLALYLLGHFPCQQLSTAPDEVGQMRWEVCRLDELDDRRYWWNFHQAEDVFPQCALKDVKAWSTAMAHGHMHTAAKLALRCADAATKDPKTMSRVVAKLQSLERSQAPNRDTLLSFWLRFLTFYYASPTSSTPEEMAAIDLQEKLARQVIQGMLSDKD